MEIAAIESFLADVRAEIEKRPLRVREVDVVAYAPPAGSKGMLALPGSALVLFAAPGSALLAEVRQAADDDRADVGELLERLVGPYRDRTPADAADALAELRAAPVIAELRYGGATLLSDFFLPSGLEVGVAVLPFAGGERRAPGGFQLAERHLDGGALEALVVLHSPSLTEAEQTALDQLGDDQLEMAVGRSKPEAMPVVLTVMVVVEVVVVVTAHQAASWVVEPGGGPKVDIADDLDPTATVGELLARRRQALEGGGR